MTVAIVAAVVVDAVVVDCGPDVVIVVVITAAVAPLPGCWKRKTSTSSLTASGCPGTDTLAL